jgi:hypothetical protein
MMRDLGPKNRVSSRLEPLHRRFLLVPKSHISKNIIVFRHAIKPTLPASFPRALFYSQGG